MASPAPMLAASASARLDPAAAGQGDDDEIQEAGQRVAEVPPPAVGICVDAEVRDDEAADPEHERTPQREGERHVRTVEGRQRGEGGDEEEAGKRQRDLLGQVALGAAIEHGEVLANPARHQPSGSQVTEQLGERTSELGSDTPLGDRGEHGRRFGHPLQLGERLGERRPGREQAPHDQPHPEAGASAQGERGDHGAIPDVGSGTVSTLGRARKRSGALGRVMRASQTKAPANIAPTSSRTSWPRAESYGAR